MREKFKIQGNVVADCCAHAFCHSCAMCQEHRELDSRGFDVPLGIYILISFNSV